MYCVEQIKLLDTNKQTELAFQISVFPKAEPKAHGFTPEQSTNGTDLIETKQNSSTNAKILRKEWKTAVNN